MKTKVVWKSEMQFEGECRELHLNMDSKPPIGKGLGLTPKELVALGIGGCTAMDVVALLKKYKQPASTFSVETDVEQTSGTHPAIFADVKLRFHVEGQVEKQKLMEAVTLSQTKFCGVSAMISYCAPIHYQVFLNGEMIGEGKADFPSPQK